MKLKKRDPNDPQVTARVLERLRQMSAEETLAMLKRRPDGIEETDMNEEMSVRSKRASAAKNDAAR